MNVLTKSEFDSIYGILRGKVKVDEVTKKQAMKQYTYRIEDGGSTVVIIDQENRVLYSKDFLGKITTRPLSKKGDEKKMKQDFQSMSDEELKTLIEQAKIEQEKRKSQRFDLLVKQFIDAAKALKDEFPFVECMIEYKYDEVNIFDYSFERQMFHE